MTTQRIEGKILRIGDGVSADLILPGRWAQVPPEEAAQHLLEELDPALPARINAADILVAGRNFGSGTGREATLRAIKAAGIRAVVAHSVARLFLRNAINNGILVLLSPGVAALDEDRLPDGTILTIDLKANVIHAAGEAHPFPPLPPIIVEIVQAGGIEAYGRQRIAQVPRGGCSAWD